MSSFAGKFAQYANWNLYLWLVLFVVTLTVELLGVFYGRQDATLTYLIRSTVPAWLRAMILGWLVYHFLIA
jgi:uncharacterized membrane protein YozB (DUF420 family)